VGNESEAVGSATPRFRTEIVSQEVKTATCFQRYNVLIFIGIENIL
jgi:hypothetical protein